MALQYKFVIKTLIEEGRITQSAIDKIRKWLKSTTLPQIQDESIALFLLSCLNDISATKHTIKASFEIKNGAPELFKDRDLDCEDLKKASKVVDICIIPRRINNNAVICLARLKDTNYRNLDLASALKLCLMFVDLCQIYDPPNELIVIGDMKGIGFMHLTCFKMGVVKAFFEYIQEALPIKIRVIHILNANYMFYKLLALVRMFIKSELLELIKTYPPGFKMEEFQKEWVPVSCLPEDYEGELPPVSKLKSDAISQLKKLKPFFKQEENMRSLCE